MRRTAIVLLLTASALWALDKGDGFAVRPAEEYPNHQTLEKITVAAVPYTTQADQKAAFDKARPYDYGILPILVVIKNDTGKVLSVELETQFVTKEDQHVDPTPAKDVQVFQGIQKVPGPQGPNPLGIPLPRRNKNGPLNVEEIDGRSWSIKLIPPGEQAYGFVYFQAQDLRGSELYLSGLRDAATKQAYFYFEIPLD